MSSLFDGSLDAPAFYDRAAGRPWNPLPLQLVSKRFLELSRTIYYLQVALDNRFVLNGRRLGKSAVQFSTMLAQDRETNSLSIRIPFPSKVLLFFLPFEERGDEETMDQILRGLHTFLPPNRVRLFSFPPLPSSSWVRSVTEQPWKSWTIVTRDKDWDVIPRIVGLPGGIARPLKSIVPPLVLRTPSFIYNVAFFETLLLRLDLLPYAPSLQIDLTFPLDGEILAELVPLLLKINAYRTWDCSEDEDEDGSKRAKTSPFGERFSVGVASPGDGILLENAFEMERKKSREEANSEETKMVLANVEQAA